MDNVSPEWIDATQARLEARFPEREVRFLGQVGPMGHTSSVFITREADGREDWIHLPWQRFEDYQTIEEILPEEVLDRFETEGSLILHNDNSITLLPPKG